MAKTSFSRPRPGVDRTYSGANPVSFLSVLWQLCLAGVGGWVVGRRGKRRPTAPGITLRTRLLLHSPQGLESCVPAKPSQLEGSTPLDGAGPRTRETPLPRPLAPAVEGPRRSKGGAECDLVRDHRHPHPPPALPSLGPAWSG